MKARCERAIKRCKSAEQRTSKAIQERKSAGQSKGGSKKIRLEAGWQNKAKSHRPNFSRFCVSAGQARPIIIQQDMHVDVICLFVTRDRLTMCELWILEIDANSVQCLVLGLVHSHGKRWSDRGLHALQGERQIKIRENVTDAPKEELFSEMISAPMRWLWKEVQMNRVPLYRPS